MFEYINKQGVRSKTGFVVQRTGRFTAEYREGVKIITIELNNGLLPDGKFCEIIRPSAFCKWDDGMPISVERQKEILNNFTEAMEFQGMGVVVE